MVSLRAVVLAVPSLAALLLVAFQPQPASAANGLQGRRWLYEFDGHDERFHKRQDTASGTGTREGDGGNGGVTLSLPTGRTTAASPTTAFPTTLPSFTTAIPTTLSTTSLPSTESTVQSTTTAVPDSSTAITTTAVQQTTTAAASPTTTPSSSTDALSSTPAAVSTVIVTTTADNGSVLTSAVLSTSTPVPSEAAQTSQGNESNSKKWIIPLSVIGTSLAPSAQINITKLTRFPLCRGYNPSLWSATSSIQMYTTAILGNGR